MAIDAASKSDFNSNFNLEVTIAAKQLEQEVFLKQVEP